MGVDILGVDILRVNILTVDILRVNILTVDILRVDILGGTQFFFHTGEFFSLQTSSSMILIACIDRFVHRKNKNKLSPNMEIMADSTLHVAQDLFVKLLL